MNNTQSKDICRKCNKYIYTHDFIVVCHIEGLAFHSKCFKLENDTALEIQQQDDWACPDCRANMFPLINQDCSINNTLLTCTACEKFISNTRHKIITCLTYSSIVHSSCASNSICKLCNSDNNCSLQSPLFN